MELNAVNDRRCESYTPHRHTNLFNKKHSFPQFGSWRYEFHRAPPQTPFAWLTFSGHIYSVANICISNSEGDRPWLKSSCHASLRTASHWTQVRCVPNRMHPSGTGRAQSLQTKYRAHKVVETENNEQRKQICACLLAASVEFIEEKKSTLDEILCWQVTTLKAQSRLYLAEQHKVKVYCCFSAQII